MSVWSLDDCLGGREVCLRLGDQVVIDGRSFTVCSWSSGSLMPKKTLSTENTEKLHNFRMHAPIRDTDTAGIQALFLELFQY